MAREKMKILLLCTANSCRSQMAEGLVRNDLGPSVQVVSAGLAPSPVHPKAIQVMRELGIDISDHRSKHLKEFEGQSFDYVVTLCDEAKEACPTIAGARRQHHFSFRDPAGARGSETDRLRVFRRVRDHIRQRLIAWIREQLAASAPAGPD